MKILIADDEPTVRRIMQAFLEKNRYEVVIAEGGQQALALLQAENAPHIAVIDWMMPDLTGPEICAKLRQTKLRIRPYLLILTSKNTDADLASGLDAGADDFLTKPFRPPEMLARLRVAERTIAGAIETQERIDELETLVERHKLLGEMIARPEPAELPPPAPAAADVPTSGLGLPEDEIDFRTVHALRELGLDAAATRRETDARRPYRVSYSAWVGLLLPERDSWVDLLLEAEPLSVNTIFARALNRPPSVAHSQAFVVEALTIISSALRATLQRRGGEPLAPFIAQGQRIDRTYQEIPVAPQAVTYFYELAGAEIALTVGARPTPVRAEPARSLSPADILADCYPPPGCSEVALFNRGTILNEHYIEKLVAYGDTTADSQPVKVYKATPLARFFLRKSSANA